MKAKRTNIKISELIEFFKCHSEQFCLMYCSAEYISTVLLLNSRKGYRLLNYGVKAGLLKFKVRRDTTKKAIPVKFYYLNKEPPAH